MYVMQWFVTCRPQCQLYLQNVPCISKRVSYQNRTFFIYDKKNMLWQHGGSTDANAYRASLGYLTISCLIVTQSFPCTY